MFAAFGPSADLWRYYTLHLYDNHNSFLSDWRFVLSHFNGVDSMRNGGSAPET